MIQTETTLEKLVNELRKYMWFALSKEDLSGDEIHVIVSPHGSAGYIRQAANIIESIAPLVRALEELVELKHQKDTKGKTLDYERRQPLAWMAAQKALKDFKDLLTNTTTD